jgi:hypothetical protein
MNPEIKARWVAALRSGEYQQTTGNLRTENGFCCLGVLCDLHSKATGIEWAVDTYGDYFYGDTDPYGVLPPIVTNWAGLEYSNPSTNDGHCLACLNDIGNDFNFIADVIENSEIL